MISLLRAAALASRRSLRVALLCLTLSSPAWGQELVVLVQPSKTTPQLQEAFNRLRGELALHGFTVEVVTVDETLSSEELARKADSKEAIASVSFENKATGPQGLRVEIWISDRVTGKTTSQTIVPEATADAPTVISVRALELLRASLREFAADEPRMRVAGAHPERAKTAVRHVRVPPPPLRSVTVGAGVSAMWSLPKGGDAYGPEVTAGYVYGAFGVRAYLLGPFQGGTANGTIGSVAYKTFVVGAEPLLFPIRSPRFTLGFFPSAGASHLSVRGEVRAPYESTADRGWLFSAGGGAEAAVRLSKTLELYTRGRGYWLLPSPVVLLGPEELSLASPTFTAGIGLRLSPGFEAR